MGQSWTKRARFLLLNLAAAQHNLLWPSTLVAEPCEETKKVSRGRGEREVGREVGKERWGG